MWTQQRDDDGEEPDVRTPYVDGAWGRTANPNSVEGELQNLAAFGAGLVRLTGRRRTAAKFVIWLLLIGVALTIVYGAIGIAAVW